MTLHDALSLRTLAVLGAGGLFAVTAATTLREPAPAPAPVCELDLDLPATAPAAPIASVAADDAPRATPYDLHFTFTAGGTTWLALADAPAAPSAAHHHARVIHDESGDSFAIAAVRALPDSARGWRDREVTFDGGCRESLHAFAVVSLVSGDAEFEPSGHWTARAIAEQGHTVLAAKLAHCTGAFASVAPFRRVAPVDDAQLAGRAKALVLESTFAAKAATDWRAMAMGHPWTDDASTDTVVARDAGTTYVSVHMTAGGIGCGSPTANFWGLYRVGPTGALEQLQLREVDFDHLESMIDIDGRIGFLGQALFPAGPILVDSDGNTRAGLVTPYVGCPC